MTKALTPLQVVRLKARRYNSVKMRRTLLNVDARLSWIFLAWMFVTGVLALMYAWNPLMHPLPNFLLYSIGCVIAHYIVVGAARRMTETFLDELCATSDKPDDCKRLSTFETDEHKPYRSEDDPPFVRKSFALREKLHLPTRGMGHLSIVNVHWFILLLYVVNYVKFFGASAEANLPSQLFMMHLVVTLGGGGMLIKNMAYLFTSRGLLTIARGILDFRESASRAISVHVASGKEENSATRSEGDRYPPHT